MAIQEQENTRCPRIGIHQWSCSAEECVCHLRNRNASITVTEVKERLDQLPERRKIFEYESTAAAFVVVRESDGSVSLTVSNFVGTSTIGVPAAQWRKMIAAFAIEPDLWPGAEHSRPWYEDTDVGKPHGEPLA